MSDAYLDRFKQDLEDQIRIADARRAGWTPQRGWDLTDEEAAEVLRASEERDEQVHQRNARMEQFLASHGQNHNEFNSRELEWIGKALDYSETETP